MNSIRHDSGENQEGLVLYDKSDRYPYKLTIFADLMQVEASKPLLVKSDENYPSGGARKPITQFSTKARKAMLSKLAKVRECSGGWFLTLTYPDEFPRSARRWKRDIATMRKRLTRAYENLGGIWRLEFQDRKSGANAGEVAPHYHLLIFGLAGEKLELRKKISQMWYEVVGSHDPKHLKAGTQVDSMSSRRHAFFYASKYAAKSDGQEKLPNGDCGLPGRFWGTFGNLDTNPAMIARLTPQQFYELKRFAARWLKSKRRKYAKRLARLSRVVGFSCFGLGDRSGAAEIDIGSAAILKLLQALAVQVAHPDTGESI